ncbi:hypothetical protein LEP48_07940 [Isoptericola sp. NEAU-Y5]|uniref:ATP-binding protein n=1 Tax=Isoptericola luteus TaxID=2879484 RepID=A0ABS7ZI68_9MICO|nr:hypothetical protein [Isoptericola sp. NEAU-Y5]MCA5893289.1 hypothetical protein [Isoptericola sp. NEAU-Y5]
MSESSLISDRQLARAVSNITDRSEKQGDLDVLRDTYVDTGVLQQVANHANQILYGRRGTGKTHVFQVLRSELEETHGSYVIYLDVRVLGSAHTFLDPEKPLAERCVAVFKDLLSNIQGKLLDIVTAPESDGSGLEEVSDFADTITRKAAEVNERSVSTSNQESTSAGTKAEAGMSGMKPGLSLGVDDNHSQTQTHESQYTEALRQSLVFSEIYHGLERALRALGANRLTILIDEWTALPVELQPFIAEFIKRSLFPSSLVTIKIASLEYRSRFTLPREGNPIGFELGPDIKANLDLDDYYVYERNADNVVEIFHELLYRHIVSGMTDDALRGYNVRDATSFRSRLFTEKATFIELVRAGEGVVRDFLGIFSSAFFKAKSTGRQKIDLNSVEEAARDWYETDKSTALSEGQRTALHRIITDVIGSRQTKMFMLSREHADNKMILSLFDLRLIHLISRGYSDKENPGQRYNIYALDYGTYVDLKRTKAEPTDFEIEEEDDTPSPRDRIVPFADKRSIRRVILRSEIFDDLE